MLNVVLDQYDYALALAVIQKNCLEENFLFLSLHLDIGPISRIRQNGLSSIAPVHSFLMDYDGLCLGDASAWASSQQQKINKIIERATKGEEVILWHRGTPETVCAFYYMNALLQTSGVSLYEGIKLTEVFTQLRFENKCLHAGNMCEVLDHFTRKISPALADRYTRIWEKLEAENGDMRVLFAPNHFPVSVTYDYFDNFILSYFPQEKSIPIKVVLHNIRKDIGGCLWEPFILYRLHTLRDNGFLEYASNLRHNNNKQIQPDIYTECWQKREIGREKPDDCKWIEELAAAIAMDLKGEDHYEEITYLLHNVPLDKSSVDKLFGLLNSHWKDEVCSTLLVRLWEHIRYEQRCELLMKLGERNQIYYQT